MNAPVWRKNVVIQYFIYGSHSTLCDQSVFYLNLNKIFTTILPHILLSQQNLPKNIWHENIDRTTRILQRIGLQSYVCGRENCLPVRLCSGVEHRLEIWMTNINLPGYTKNFTLSTNLSPVVGTEDVLPHNKLLLGIGKIGRVVGYVWSFCCSGVTKAFYRIVSWRREEGRQRFRLSF